MARSLPREPEREMCGGMYEWNVQPFLESTCEVSSPKFKFGEYDSCLNLCCYQVPTVDGFMRRNFQIKLIIIELFESDTISKFLRACFISSNGDLHFNTVVHVDPFLKCNYFTVMWLTLNDVDAEFKKFAELITDESLTFRLAWSDDVHTLRTMILQKTPKDQIKGKISAKSSEKLFKDLEAFYENRTNTDCVLKVGGEEFPVNRGLLCARSSVFAAMFHHDTSERQSGIVEISDISPGILNNVLRYIYTGHILGLTSDTAASMHAAADKYALIEMKDDCLKFLRLNLTIENIVDAIKLAHFHEDSKLKEKIIMFMQDNLEEIEENGEWNAFLKANSFLAIKYLHSAWNAASKPKHKKPKNEHY